MILCILALLLGMPVWSAAAEAETERDVTGMMEDSLLEELELEEMQDSVDRLLGESELSVEDSWTGLWKEKIRRMETELGENIISQIRRAFREQKETWIQMLILVLAAALLSNFAALFENGQMGEMAFYMIYLLVFALLLKNFSGLKRADFRDAAGTGNFYESAYPGVLPYYCRGFRRIFRRHVLSGGASRGLAGGIPADLSDSAGNSCVSSAFLWSTSCQRRISSLIWRSC